MNFPRTYIFIALLFIGTGVLQSASFVPRVGNTTLNLAPAPPKYSYSTTNAFPGVNFLNPVAIAFPPGETNRLFIVEQQGYIAVITNLLAPTRTVFLDISNRVSSGASSSDGETGFLGLTFHPGYATNRQFFVFYSTMATSPATAGESALHQQLSRFEVSSDDPNQADPDSEVPVLTMFDRGGVHNAGDLHFGPDDYLYVSQGDEGGPNLSAPVIDNNFWSGILRIDVDNRPENLEPNPHPAINPGTYRVPRDNPFVGVTNWYGSNLFASKVRTEFYAIGLRNPWRMSFDPVSGRLYCGDVGGLQREEIDVIVKGGNYGWPFREGRVPGIREAPPGAASIDPIWEYVNGVDGNAVIGGVVYRGLQDPYLYGAYVFGDFSGRIWTLRYDGNVTTDFRLLTADSRICAFGTDPRNGDVLFLQRNFTAGSIRRLVPVQLEGQPFPAALAETGAFQNLTNLQPGAGFAPYKVILPEWTDRVEATRWFYVPPAATIGFNVFNNWSFPAGSVLVQHFDLETTNGVAESRRKVETRLLVRTSTSSYGLSYRWDDSQTNASLVFEEGLTDRFAISDGGIVRTQVWRYSGIQECRQCHNAGAFSLQALGFNTVQLNRDEVYDGGITNNQIVALSRAGYFSFPLDEEAVNRFRFLSGPDDVAASVEYRVRSYLSVNCGSCHQSSLPRSGNFDARMAVALSRTSLIDGRLNDSDGNPSNKVVVPGSPEHSVLLKRMSSSGHGRMPPLTAHALNTQAVDLVTQWIGTDLLGYQNFADWQQTHFNSTNAPGSGPNDDPDSDGAKNLLEYLTATDPLEAGDGWRVRIDHENEHAVIVYPRVANRIFEAQSATDPLALSAWQAVTGPANRPFPSSTNGQTRIMDRIVEGAARFYRVRVTEP